MDAYEALGGIAALLFVAIIVFAIWYLHSEVKEEDEQRKLEDEETQDEIARLKGEVNKLKGGKK